jgi:hypothetical protein
LQPGWLSLAGYLIIQSDLFCLNLQTARRRAARPVTARAARLVAGTCGGPRSAVLLLRVTAAVRARPLAAAAPCMCMPSCLVLNCHNNLRQLG